MGLQTEAPGVQKLSGRVRHGVWREVRGSQAEVNRESDAGREGKERQDGARLGRHSRPGKECWSSPREPLVRGQ